MERTPVAPSGKFAWDRRQPSTGHRPCHGLTAQLRPQAFSSAVVHQQVALIKETRNAEDYFAAMYLAVEDDSTRGERAIGDGQRLAADTVIDDFMPVHDAERIGLGFTTACDADNLVIVGKKVRFLGTDEFGVKDGGDAIFGWTAADNLFRRHDVSRQIERVRDRLRRNERAGGESDDHRALEPDGSHEMHLRSPGLGKSPR